MKRMQVFMEADGTMGGGSAAPETTATSVPVATETQADANAGSRNQGTASVGGQLKLVRDERTGRNRVEFAGGNTEPAPQEQQAHAQPETTQPQQPQIPNAELPRLDAILTQPNQAQQTVSEGLMTPAPVQEYTLPELSAAMQLGLVDESRVPEAYKQAYINAKTADNTFTQPQAENAAQANSEANTAVEAQAFYSRVAAMAQERAMQEVGITKEELDTAEYTDDETIIEKYRAYQAAQENNRMRILSDVNRLKEQEYQRQNDNNIARNEIINFAQQMKVKEPNFDAIDKFMIERVDTMPYVEAQKIVPILQRVRNGSVTTSDLPALQKYFEESRLAFYSQKTGVGIAPQVVPPSRPTFTEAPGNGAEIAPETVSTSMLGKLSYRDKIKAIGQMFQPKE